MAYHKGVFLSLEHADTKIWREMNWAELHLDQS